MVRVTVVQTEGEEWFAGHGGEQPLLPGVPGKFPVCSVKSSVRIGNLATPCSRRGKAKPNESRLFASHSKLWNVNAPSAVSSVRTERGAR
jgi:hypothetical protein